MKERLGFGKRDLIRRAGSSMFVAVAITSVVAAFSVVILNFMWSQASYNDRVQGKKELARDTLIDNISAVSALKESFDALQAANPLVIGQGVKDNATVILDALPQRYDFPALRTSVEQLVVISNVRLTSFVGDDQQSLAVDKMVVPEPIEIPFEVAVEGPYANIKAFIANLENTIRPMRVTNLVLSGSDTAMTASLKVVTYYQPRVDIGVTMEKVQ